MPGCEMGCRQVVVVGGEVDAEAAPAEGLKLALPRARTREVSPDRFVEKDLFSPHPRGLRSANLKLSAQLSSQAATSHGQRVAGCCDFSARPG